MVIRIVFVVLLLAAFSVQAGNVCTSDGGVSSGACGTPMPTHFAIFTPDAAAINQAAKLSRTATGLGLCCFARGTTTPFSVSLDLRECDNNGASCASTGGIVTLSAFNTELCDNTLTDFSWAAGGVIEVDVTAVTGTTPSAVFCRADANLAP